MSTLITRSLLILALLFGLLFAVGSAVLWYYNVPIWFAIIFPVVIVGLQYLLGPHIIGWIFRINWMIPEGIGPRFAQFLKQACARDRIPVPRFGVIEDGNPNAFTYGRVPGDARLVVTRGLVNMLNEDELEAVVGHELGHIKHWDFVVMTIASLIPLMLYYLYLFARQGSRGRVVIAGVAAVVAVASYAAYILSQYIVLFLSRVREYYADYHAARTTRNPNALATALVTIAYGLAKASPAEPEDSGGGKTRAFDRTAAISSLSFFGRKGVSHFAMAAADVSGNFSPENMKQAMRWDLHNPWARWFELHSTHPLPARRIREVERYAGYARQSPVYEFAAQAPSYRNKFIADLTVALLPYVGALIGAYLAWAQAGRDAEEMVSGMGLPILFFGVGMLVRTLFSYRSEFRPSEVVSLVTETDVSHIRPIPAVIKGKIIGRGIPGLFWSDDLVIRDESGFITLIYRQPLRLLEFLFGWLKAGDLIGREAIVHGWYRRGPGPYFEMKHATFTNGEAVNCYYYQYLVGLSVVLTVVGAVWAFGMPALLGGI